MGIESKHAYRFEFLNSEEWSTIRAEVLAAESARCYICEVEDASNDVHHMFYRRHWRDTAAADCHVLCRRCHDLVHGHMGNDELKGMNSFDLRRAFLILAEVLKQRFKSEVELNRSSRTPTPFEFEKPKVEKPLDDPDFIGPRKPKKPVDFLRESMQKARDECREAKAEVQRLTIENEDLRARCRPPEIWTGWSI